MSDKCQYFNCNNYRKKNDSLHMHRFPPDEKRCKEWIYNSGNESLADLSLQQLRNKRICSAHFEDNAFKNSLKDRLRWNAVPVPFKIIQSSNYSAPTEHILLQSSPERKTASPINDPLNLPGSSNYKILKTYLDMPESNQEDKIISEIKRETASPTPCYVCTYYEAELDREKQLSFELQKKLSFLENLLKKQKEDLLQEIRYRKDLKEKWNEKEEEYKEQIAELNKKTLCAEQDLEELKKTFEQTYTSVSNQLLTSKRKRTDSKILQSVT